MINVNGPVGLDAASRVLRKGLRSVLVVVPFVAAGTRLMDVLPLLEADHRITVMFTVPPTPNGARCSGADDFVRAQGGQVLPWRQAVDSEFDLVLAASETALDQVHGNILIMSHGVGSVQPRTRARSAGAQAFPHHSLARAALVNRGRLLPAALALNNDGELDILRDSCPEALPVAFVAGDICYDRLMTSLPFRDHYRRALRVDHGQTLVTVTSTWRPESVMGQHPELLDRLTNELPSDKYRVAAVLHPGIWGVHGPWQVRAWLADALRAGLLLIPPDEGWRATVVAADVVIGDYGSVTGYAAASGTPILLTGFPPDEHLRAGTVGEMLEKRAPRLATGGSMLDQLGTAASSTLSDDIRPLITSRPGEADSILRRTMYRLLGLPEPVRALPRSPVPVPVPITRSEWS